MGAVAVHPLNDGGCLFVGAAGEQKLIQVGIAEAHILLIGLPIEIYTPLFAMARIVGWCAHRNEELCFNGRRIIRPAYRCVAEPRPYVPVKER